ncbi:uncharacterized protein BJ171DRAFT_476253 [Polychytrium aggregatum]|uniref:uncharacterized protein n=1 Tax=Polychytrium aggregatum TaxID=110093 RepID=UPI0022FE499A|nr:uncharacterized protein BJ171DRAFT_476253 [Polychytrium aggregatum]KAI9203044.1 hypothetical protein BJ171DRAFT_476253 [Polychytrium aggregatum]
MSLPRHHRRLWLLLLLVLAWSIPLEGMPAARAFASARPKHRRAQTNFDDSVLPTDVSPEILATESFVASSSPSAAPSQASSAQPSPSPSAAISGRHASSPSPSPPPTSATPATVETAPPAIVKPKVINQDSSGSGPNDLWNPFRVLMVMVLGVAGFAVVVTTTVFVVRSVVVDRHHPLYRFMWGSTSSLSLGTAERVSEDGLDNISTLEEPLPAYSPPMGNVMRQPSVRSLFPSLAQRSPTGRSSLGRQPTTAEPREPSTPGTPKSLPPSYDSLGPSGSQ